MSDNTTLPGSGETVRDIDRSGVKTQVVAIDVGGMAGEQLASEASPVPTADNTLSYLMRRIIALLMSPRGYDKSQARQRVTAAIESGTVTTVTTVTTCSTVSNIAQIAGRDAGTMQINPTNRMSWALNHRSRIS